ncbi:MAG: glycosyltransferase, partial [Clostridia bacterium]|nr:glycosyltransferase [Clostridia bacterium]
MDLISVIVPVYNVEKYLDTCVESIVSQTYDNLEIILVDDGSTDSCPRICDEWALKDPRVKVIHKENGGLSSARNAGMEIAKGEYIGFVDSDDVISPFMFETLYYALIEARADVAQCGFIKFNDYSELLFPVAEEKTETKVFNNHDAVESLLTGGPVSVECCTKLINATLAKSVLFETGRINEDVLWTYRILAKAECVVTVDNALYGYFQRPGSIMNDSYTEKRFDAINALSQRALEIKTDFPDLFPLAERACAGLCMYHYQWLCRLPNTQEYIEFRARLHKMFLSRDLKAVYSVTELKYKIWYTAFRL